jgi:hypothetical protein
LTISLDQHDFESIKPFIFGFSSSQALDVVLGVVVVAEKNLKDKKCLESKFLSHLVLLELWLLLRKIKKVKRCFA